MPSPQDERAKVFVSYSHKNRRWLERLQVHLKPLTRDGSVELWDDTKLQTGTQWRDEINKALDSARAAILLISADFLASDFIANNELPPLLARAEENGVVILPLILSPSRFEKIESLSRFMTVNPPSKPLNKLKKAEQEEYLVKVSEDVLRVIEGSYKSLTEEVVDFSPKQKSLFQKIGDLEFATVASATSIRVTHKLSRQASCAFWVDERNEEGNSWLCREANKLGGCEEQLKIVCETYSALNCRKQRESFAPFETDFPVGITGLWFDAALRVRNPSSVQQHFSLTKVITKDYLKHQTYLMGQVPLRDSKWSDQDYPIEFNAWLKKSSDDEGGQDVRFTLAPNEQVILDLQFSVSPRSSGTKYSPYELLKSFYIAQDFATHLKNGLSGLWLKVDVLLGKAVEHEFSIEWSDESDDLKIYGFDIEQLVLAWEHIINAVQTPQSTDSQPFRFRFK